MGYILINLLPILAASAAGFVLTALCVSVSPTFRAAAAGPRGTAIVAAAALLQVWLCAILAGALILAPVQAGRWTVALGSAIIIWIGFIMPALVVTETARGRSFTSAAGDSLFWLALMLTQAAVLRLFQLVASAS